jgi:hypothetical protein
MRQRGRRSAAALEVINVNGRPDRLEPPRYLNKTERAVFVELAATRHFVPTDAVLLASLAQATVMARRVARDPAKSAVWERAVKMQDNAIDKTSAHAASPHRSKGRWSPAAA